MILVKAKYRRFSDEDRYLLNSNRKIDLNGAWTLAELFGEYHRFLYLHTKLQLNAFNEKIRLDVRELISMQIQGWMHQKAKQRNTDQITWNATGEIDSEDPSGLEYDKKGKNWELRTHFLVACTRLYKPLCPSVRQSLFTKHATYSDRPCFVLS